MSTDARKFERVEDDSPERCQANHANGQCSYKQAFGTEYCPMHGAHHGERKIKAEMKRAYQLGKWQAQVDEFADEDQVKSLRGEIGISRMLMQETLKRCKDSGELMMMSGKIIDMVAKLERLVSACHRLESNLGLMLDKPKIISLAAQIVEIISEHLPDDEAIATVANKIVQSILDTQGAKRDT